MQETILLREALVEGRFDVNLSGADVGDLPIERVDYPLACEAFADALFNLGGKGLVNAHTFFLLSEIAFWRYIEGKGIL